MMAKVRKVRTDQGRKKLKAKDKLKKSKPKRVKTKASLEKVDHQPGDPAPSSYVQEDEVDGEARIDKTAKQSQKVLPHLDFNRALTWLSHPTITDNGNLKVSFILGIPRKWTR